MKTQFFIILFLCLLFQACKAKTDNKIVQKKTPDKIIAQTIKQKSTAVVIVNKTDQTAQTSKPTAAVIVNKAGQAAQTNKPVAAVVVNKADQSEDLKLWKEKVAKDLKPIPLKSQSAMTISSTVKKEITTAKNVKKKELVMADKTMKRKTAETTKKLELSKDNNFGKIQKVEYKEIK